MASTEKTNWAERRLQGGTIHYQHQFKDTYPETRKKTMLLHAKRSYQYEYLKPGEGPVPFDSEKHGENIHNVVDAVKKSPPTPDMRMVLVDGKWRLMTNTVKADFESSVPS